jgi:hypothetical protein
MTRCIEQDAEGCYISEKGRGAMWRGNGRALEAFRRGGYPLQNIVVEQMAFFMPMAPAVLRAIYEQSNVAKTIAAKYPNGMPLRLAGDSIEDSEEDMSPACILAYDDSTRKFTVRVRRGDGSYATEKGNLEHLLSRIEEKHLVHKVERYHGVHGIDCTLSGVRDGVVTFEHLPFAFGAPVAAKPSSVYTYDNEEEEEEKPVRRRKNCKTCRTAKQKELRVRNCKEELEDEKDEERDSEGDKMADVDDQEAGDADGERRVRKQRPKGAASRKMPWRKAVSGKSAEERSSVNRLKAAELANVGKMCTN